MRQSRVLIGLLAGFLLLVGIEAQASDPTNISGLVFWGRANQAASITRANGGRCSALADSSGNGNNATQSTSAQQPAIIDGPSASLAFEIGQNENLSLPAGVSLAYTHLSCFMVWDFDLQPSSLAANQQNQILWGNTGGGQPLYVTSGNSTSTNELVSNCGFNARSGLKIPSGRHLIGVVSTGTQVTLYVDDQSVVVTGTTSAATGVTGWYIGGQANFNNAWSNYVDGVIYNVTLTDAQVAQLYGYFQTAYNLPSHSSIQANVVCVGTSITVGVGVQTNSNWLRQLGLDKRVQVFGRGCASVQYGAPASSSTLTAVAATQIDTLLDNTKPYNVLVLDAPTNDIVNGGVSAATAYSNMQSFIAARVTAGWHNFVVQTMLPRNASESVRTAFNTLLRGIPGTVSGANIVVADCGGDATIGGASAYSSTVLYLDGIHPTTYGNSIMASYIAPAINSFLPHYLGGTLAPSSKGGF